MRVTWFFTSKKVMRVHVLAASLLSHTPSPGAVLPRMSVSPPPTQTMSGFEAATPIEPTVPPKYLSVTGCQFMPPSVVLNTPLPDVPM